MDSSPAVLHSAASLATPVVPPHPGVRPAVCPERVDRPRLVMWVYVLRQTYGALHVCGRFRIHAAHRGLIGYDSAVQMPIHITFLSSSDFHPFRLPTLMIPFLSICDDALLISPCFGDFCCVQLKSTHGPRFLGPPKRQKPSKKKCQAANTRLPYPRHHISPDLR